MACSAVPRTPFSAGAAQGFRVFRQSRIPYSVSAWLPDGSRLTTHARAGGSSIVSKIVVSRILEKRAADTRDPSLSLPCGTNLGAGGAILEAGERTLPGGIDATARGAAEQPQVRKRSHALHNI